MDQGVDHVLSRSKRIKRSAMLSNVGRDRLCFARLALLALLLMQGYSSVDASADTAGKDQPVSSQEVSEANAAASAGQRFTGPEPATEELIAGRGYQKFRTKAFSSRPVVFSTEPLSSVLPMRMPTFKVRLEISRSKGQPTAIFRNFGERLAAPV
jgi:hypothetical protein